MSSALPLPSDRSFGFTFFVVFLLVAGWAGWTDRVQLALTCASLSAITLLVALLRPSLLHPLTRAWMKLGAVLHAIVSPIIMGFIFFLIFAPVGIAMRMAGRDALRRRKEPDIPTYWIELEPPGPSPDSLPHQF